MSEREVVIQRSLTTIVSLEIVRTAELSQPSHNHKARMEAIEIGLHTAATELAKAIELDPPALLSEVTPLEFAALRGGSE